MATRKQAQKYTEDNIQVFAGLEGIRRKPSMYVGDMNEAPWTCVREVADNCQDEFLAGRNDSCLIVYDGDYVWVADKGEGIPVKVGSVDENGKIVKESRLKSILSRTHAGGKFNDSAYKVSAGTHGVGIKAVNALSEEFDVWTCRDKVWYHTSYSKGKEVEPVAKSKAPRIEKARYTPKVGTVVRFKLDSKLFPKGAKFNDVDAHKWADFNTHLNAGFKVVVISEDGSSTTYEQPNGLWGLVERKYKEHAQGDVSFDEISGYTNTGYECEIDNNGNLLWFDFAVVFPSNVEGVHLDLYTNGVTNPDGGVHGDAFWQALEKALKDFAPARAKYTLNDVKEGVIGILNVKINEPSFNNQTKEKLVDVRVKNPLRDGLYAEFYEFFKSNKSLVKEICERASALSEFRASVASRRKSLLNIKRSNSTKPAKFAGVTGRVPKEKVEIFFVEGDSAGGSAKQARYKDFQAVLPLKGKPMNAMKASDEAILASEEVLNIFNAIGYVPDGKSKPDGFGKIILLSDSDVDGYHINALVLTLIQKYMPDLFTEGKVFVADTSNCKLFGRGRKGDYYFGATSEGVHASAKSAGDSIVGKTSYLKGWGELDPIGLRSAAMNPSTRKLIQITGLTPKQARQFELLMGDDVNERKRLLGI